MAAPGQIRAGRAYVEIGGDDSKMVAALRAASAKLRAWGSALTGIGAKVGAAGVAAATPFLAGAKSFASYEQALAELRAAANPTAEELEKIKASISSIGEATGRSRTDVAAAFTELLKAGMSVETVMGGAAEAAVKFARVGGLDVATAATVMTNAMNVFKKEGVDAAGAIDIISKAADASSINIEQVAQAFSMSASVFGPAGMAMNDLASALGILGSSGMAGSDAGTSMKTFLLRLQTGAETAGLEMERLGINVRDGAGNMLPMRGIIAELESKMVGMSNLAKSQSIMKLFGSDSVRAGNILLAQGVAGWDAYQEKLRQSLTVSQKFAIVTDTVGEKVGFIWSAIKRVGEDIGDSIKGPMTGLTNIILQTAGAVGEWVGKNKGAVVAVAAVVAGTIAAGAAFVGIGLALKVAGIAMAGFAVAAKVAFAAIGAIVSPVGLVVATVGALGGVLLYASGVGEKVTTYLSGAFLTLKDDVGTAVKGISDALSTGDWSLAAEIAWTTLKIVWQRGVNEVGRIWNTFGPDTLAFFSETWTGVLALSEMVWSALSDGWTAAVEFFTKAWHSAIWGIRRAWIELREFIKNTYQGTKEFVDQTTSGTVGRTAMAELMVSAPVEEQQAMLAGMSAKDRAEMEKLLAAAKAKRDATIQHEKELQEEKAKVDKEANEAIAAAQREADAKREANHKRHTDRMAEISGAGAKQEKDLRDASTFDEQDANDRLAALAKRREELNKKAAAGVVAGPGGPGGAPALPKPPDIGGIADAVDRLSRSTVGTFSAVAAGMLGRGTDHAAETAKNTKVIARAATETASKISKVLSFS